MGLLDSIVGSLGGQAQPQGQQLSPLVTALIQMVANHPGGLSGLVQTFQQKGLGDVVSSWVGTGANLPVSADQIQQTLGGDVVAQLARAAGLTHDGAADQIAQALPQLVDHATPQGALPAAGEDPFGSLLKSFGA